MDTVLVFNKSGRILSWSPKEAKPLSLKVGENKVPFDVVKALFTHPIFEGMVSKDLISILSHKATDFKNKGGRPAKESKEEKVLPPQVEPNLDHLSQRQLVRRITEIEDKEQLEALAEDGRPRVAQAAKEQLEQLDKE